MGECKELELTTFLRLGSCFLTPTSPSTLALARVTSFCLQPLARLLIYSINLSMSSTATSSHTTTYLRLFPHSHQPVHAGSRPHRLCLSAASCEAAYLFDRLVDGLNSHIITLVNVPSSGLFRSPLLWLSGLGERGLFFPCASYHANTSLESKSLIPKPKNSPAFFKAVVFAFLGPTGKKSVSCR